MQECEEKGWKICLHHLLEEPQAQAEVWHGIGICDQRQATNVETQARIDYPGYMRRHFYGHQALAQAFWRIKGLHKSKRFIELACTIAMPSIRIHRRRPVQIYYPLSKADIARYGACCPQEQYVRVSHVDHNYTCMLH